MITLEAALRYHALGLCLIPLRPETKRPDGTVLPLDEDKKAIWKPYQSRRPTEDELRAWFGNGVRRNAGIPLGPVSGVIVVESDTTAAEAWCAANLLPTPMMTRSARGFHRYYRMPVGFEGLEIPADIDAAPGLKIEIKREGNYIVAPGSVHPGDPEHGIPPGHVYTEVEPWPTTLDAVPEFPVALIWDNGQRTKTRARTSPLPGIIPKDVRNITLMREAGRLRRLGWDETEMIAALTAINNNRCDPGLDDAEIATIARSCAKYAPAIDTFPLTESGDAEFFAACNADVVRYNYRTADWLQFNGQYWATQTDGGIHRLALEATRGRYRAAGGDAPREKWAIAGESRKRQGSLLALAQHMKPLADDGAVWDSNPLLLGVQNGSVDLETGALRPGQAHDWITKVTPVAYDPSAACPRWERFLREIFSDQPETVDYVQRVLGYTLTGVITEQVFWTLWGEGANGKSTLIETFGRHVLGGHDYGWTIPFPTAGWSNAMSEYQKAMIAGRRFVTASEVEGRGQLNEALIKTLTGDDEINARHPCGRPFVFKPMAKFFLRVNDKPKIRDQSHAMWRRVKLIAFTQKFAIDKSLPDVLASEAPGILAWAVRGCVEWQRDGLQEPASVTKATDLYHGESNPLADFYEERCVIDPSKQKKVQAQALFNDYLTWCRDRQVPEAERLNLKTFGKSVAADPRFRVEQGRNTFYFGIGLQAVAM